MHKDTVLKRAEQAAPKPQYTDKFYSAFIRSLNPKCKEYDSQFAENLRCVAPHWFISNKEKLLSMANNKERKPKHKSPLYNSLLAYTNPKNKLYDESFTSLIKQLRPHWFPKP